MATGVYDASKAAVHSLDSAMSAELAPLGIGVLTVVAGSVKTSLMENGPTMKLPSTSKYRPLEKELTERAAGAGMDWS